MKAILCFFILIIQSFLLIAQKNEWVKSASYYDSLTRTVDSCNIYNYSFLVGIYKRENKLPELKKSLEKAVRCPLRNYIQRGFYLELADIYIKEGQFRKALDLTILFDSTKYKVKRPHNPYEYISDFSIAIKRSICYKELGRTDSAIYELSPFMFYKHNYFQGYYDSLSYNAVLKSYLTLLRSKYSITELQSELHQAETRFYFQDIADKTANQFGSTRHKIICGFPFFKFQIKYLDMEMFVQPQHGSSYLGNYNLDYQFNYFKEAPIYSIIRTL